MQSTPVVVTTSQLPASPPAVSALQKDDAQMVDFVSSFAFPIMFIIFNIIYWMVYLNSKLLYLKILKINRNLNISFSQFILVHVPSNS